jgi:hypothetical protein
MRGRYVADHPFVSRFGKRDSHGESCKDLVIECPADDMIERGPKWAAWAAMGVSAQRSAYRFDVTAELQRKRARDRGISRVSICAAPVFVVGDEQLADPPIGVPTNRNCVLQAVDLDLEGQAEAPIRKSLASLGP